MRDRKRRNLYNYRIRSVWRGREAIYMNVEEMASIFHFPTIDVKAGQVQKTETKRGGAPVYLPTETPQIIQKMRTPGAAAKASAPVALPAEEKLTPPPGAAPSKPEVLQPPASQPQIPTNLPFIE